MQTPAGAEPAAGEGQLNPTAISTDNADAMRDYLASHGRHAVITSAPYSAHAFTSAAISNRGQKNAYRLIVTH